MRNVAFALTDARHLLSVDEDVLLRQVPPGAAFTT